MEGLCDGGNELPVGKPPSRQHARPIAQVFVKPTRLFAAEAAASMPVLTAECPPRTRHRSTSVRGTAVRRSRLMLEPARGAVPALHAGGSSPPPRPRLARPGPVRRLESAPQPVPRKLRRTSECLRWECEPSLLLQRTAVCDGSPAVAGVRRVVHDLHLCGEYLPTRPTTLRPQLFAFRK
ncbi:hypothetical protein ANN_07365 [Periplaneta americana]|uniref:Uncharacterized protein n=1 Tax=Periplaneta americana TaxID=6978 RepID=A0ABQ8T0N6_PERAM|nr:hypothetical protein ANN_07365 [Periplaneta americana]